MIQLNELVDIIAINFFGGSIDQAGVVIFALVMVGIFAVTRNVFQSLVLALPITFLFSMLGLLPSDMVVLLIIVVVLGLATTSKKVWGKP